MYCLLGDAGGSGVFVFDEIVPELAVTPDQYAYMREQILDRMGLLPPAAPASVEERPVNVPGLGPGISYVRHPANEARDAALQMSKWYKEWWDNRPADVGVTGGRFRDIYVELPPTPQPTFRPPFVDDIYGPSEVNWIDLPGPPYVVLARLPTSQAPSWMPDRFPQLANAPIYEIPLWKAWGDNCDTIQNACSRMIRVVALPARRVGVSSGDRHGITLLRHPNGTPYGWIGRYEPGGSGNFFQTGIGQFFAREVAGAIIEVVLTVVTVGAGIAILPELIGLLDKLPFSPAKSLADAATNIIPTAIREAPVPVQVAVAIETANQIDPAAVQHGFAQAALVSTYFVGLDNLLMGLGSLFRMMAVDLQDDQKTLSKRLAQRQAEIAGFVGPIGLQVVAIAQVVAEIAVSIATAGVAAPYLAALHAIETAIAAAHDGSNTAAMRNAGMVILNASLAFVPVVGGELQRLASIAEVAAKGDVAHAGASLAGMLVAMIPDAGRALATAGAAVVAAADIQDALRKQALASDRREARIAAAKSNQAANAVETGVRARKSKSKLRRITSSATPDFANFAGAKPGETIQATTMVLAAVLAYIAYRIANK